MDRSLFPESPLQKTGALEKWEPLVQYQRNGVSENTIHGAIAFYSGEKLVHSFGGDVLCYGRSLMKPFYIKVFAKELAHLRGRQKAISLASHNGCPEHVEAAQSILSKEEWGLLKTPRDLPLVPFGKSASQPQRWLNNSSGHHAAILLGCRLKGWKRAGYTLPSHRVFQAYKQIMKSRLGKGWEPRQIAKDGDGLPTLSMTLGELARCYGSVANNPDEDWIWESMVRHPDLVGGFNRLDSTILKSGKGKVIAKEGAGGLLGLAIQHEDYKEGLGVVIKIAHGWDPQATWYVARAILGVLGIELRNPYPLHRQKAFIAPGIVPKFYRVQLEKIITWDEWDPDRDRWHSFR